MAIRDVRPELSARLLRLRNLFATVAIFAIAASLASHAIYLPALWTVVLVIGGVVLVPGGWWWFFTARAAGVTRPPVPSIRSRAIAAALFAVLLISFLVDAGSAFENPEKRDGHYVSTSHGNVTGVLTKSEYEDAIMAQGAFVALTLGGIALLCAVFSDAIAAAAPEDAVADRPS